MHAIALATQLIVVVSGGWDADHGELRRYERDGDAWKQVGEIVAVELGDRGLAWGRGLHPFETSGPQKTEGDHRSPAGVFAIGPVHDRAPLVCVDDPRSPDYNQIVKSGRGEDMSRYRRAVVIGQNPSRKRGAGSCVFLHDGHSPTVGCTAMAPAALDEIVAWSSHAILVQLPRPVYQRVRKKWKLP